MTQNALILSDAQRSAAAEIIERMKRKEPGLYIRYIPPLVIVRRDKNLQLPLKRFARLVKAGKYKKLRSNSHVHIFHEVRR